MTREEAIKILSNRDVHGIPSGYNGGYAEAIDLAIETLKAEPKHGHWIDEGLVDGNQNRYCRCSECGKGDTQAISQRVPYCWWCGAKMDEPEAEP